jgi:streptogramin lyase
MRIEISGAPSGSSPSISVSGPGGFSKTISGSEVFTNLASGTYEFKSEVIVKRQPFISQAFRLDNLNLKVIVKNDTQRVNLAYKLMPGSDKLWMGNQNAPANTSTKLIAFDEAALGATQTSNATAKVTDKATSPRGIAFDRYGNLWMADAYTLKMYEWNALGKSNVSAKVVLTFKDAIPCVTFDAGGNLWISNGKRVGTISRIPATKLYAGGTPAADIVLSGSGISGVQNMAFDAQGNMWVNHDEKKSIVKLNAASLSSSSSGVEAGVMITCQSKPPVKMTLSGPKALAFDKNGNLWVGFFGPNVIAMIPSVQQNTTDTITPDVQITLSVGVLLHSLAFDENGGLWTALSTGKFGKLSPEQLQSAAKVSPEVIISSPDLKYGSGLAFYPFPEGLPLK